MKSYKNSILIITILLSALPASCGKYNDSICITDWEINYNKISSVTESSRSGGWVPVEIPSTFKITDTKLSKFNYIWLRGKFNITGDPLEYSGISLGRVYHADKVYINNHYINSLVPDKYNSISSIRNYSIPAGITKKGENIVCINLGIYSDWYGGILDQVLVQPDKEFRQSELLYNILYLILPMGVVLFLFMLFIITLIFASWHRKEIILICGMITSAVNLIYILSIYSPYNPFSINTSSSIQMVFVPVTFIIGLFTAQSMYRIYFSMINKIIIPILCIITFFIILNNQIWSDNLIYFIFLLVFFIILGPSYLIMLYILNNSKPDRFNSNILFFISFIYGLAIITETFLHFTGSLFPRVLITYIIPFASIGFLIQVARDTAKRSFEMEMLYDKLKAPEKKHAVQDELQFKENLKVRGGENKISITDGSEEKLKRVIKFIEENFTFDISREGLAAAVGMNPNYMGSMFRVFTGMKISQYINKLRIENAAARLKDKEEKVLDIALSVGFESLSTFNRAFKAVMNTTPTEYRDQIHISS